MLFSCFPFRDILIVTMSRHFRQRPSPNHCIITETKGDIYEKTVSLHPDHSGSPGRGTLSERMCFKARCGTGARADIRRGDHCCGDHSGCVDRCKRNGSRNQNRRDQSTGNGTGGRTGGRPQVVAENQRLRDLRPQLQRHGRRRRRRPERHHRKAGLPEGAGRRRHLAHPLLQVPSGGQWLRRGGLL